MVTYSFRSITILFFVSFILLGCAHHAPMSELKMYQEKRYEDGETAKTRYAHAIVGASLSYFEPVSQLETNSGKILNEPSGAGWVGMSSIFMRPEDSNFATSISYGFGLIGFDMTFRLFPSLEDHLYLTVGFTNLPTNYQLILQRRLMDGNQIGLSLGVHVKQLQIWYSQYGPCYGFSCGFNYDRFIAFGPRATFILSGHPNPAARQRTMLYSNLSVNYAPELQLFYLNVGLSFVIH